MAVGVVTALEAHLVACDVSVAYVVITATAVFTASWSVEASARFWILADLSSFVWLLRLPFNSLLLGSSRLLCWGD